MLLSRTTGGPHVGWVVIGSAAFVLRHEAVNNSVLRAPSRQDDLASLDGDLFCSLVSIATLCSLGGRRGDGILCIGRAGPFPGVAVAGAGAANGSAAKTDWGACLEACLIQAGVVDRGATVALIRAAEAHFWRRHEQYPAQQVLAAQAQADRRV